MAKRLPHLVKIIDTQTGLELIEPWKNQFVRIAGIAVIITILISIYLLTQNIILGGCILGGVLVVIYPIMAYNANSTRVHINTMQIDIRHGPMAYRGPVNIPGGDIRDIIKTPSGKNKVALQAKLQNGKTITLLNSLPDDSRVDFIIRQARRHLNLIKAAQLPVLTVARPSSGKSDFTVAGDPAIRPGYS